MALNKMEEDEAKSDSTLSGAGAADTPPSESERVTIGLAFGNSNSSIAWTNAEGKTEVIANEEGDRQIPSVLSYINGEEYGGAQAKAQLVRNSKNTVVYFRDFVGKGFKDIDPTNCHAAAHPVEKDGQVGFNIIDQPDSESPSFVTIETIVIRHLRRLISSASDYIGRKVSSAVITVPTNFSPAQESALRLACASVPLEVLQIIREPTAALLAYDSRNVAAHSSDKTVLIADIGGTRSDVSVIASRGGMYTTLATTHDYTLGGKALDQVLIDHFSTQFQRKYTDLPDPRSDARALAKLTLECESCRKTLSQSTTAPCSVESLVAGKDYSANIQRTRFEVLAGSIFTRIAALLTDLIAKAGLDVLDVDEVILSGGASHTPKIARMLQGIFPEHVPIRAPSTDANAMNPSELCARGAAIQASLIDHFEIDDIVENSSPVVTLTHHLRHPIGVMLMGRGSTKTEGEDGEALADGVKKLKIDPHTTESIRNATFRPILAADTPAPSRRTVQIPTLPGGGDVLIRFCEGENYVKSTPKAKPPKLEKKPDDDSDDVDEESDEDEDEEMIREKLWRAKKVIAEAELKRVKKGAKVEITLSLEKEGGLAFTCWEVGGASGVRGRIEVQKVNGSA